MPVLVLVNQPRSTVPEHCSSNVACQKLPLPWSDPPSAGGEPMTTQAGQQTAPTWDISPGAYGALSEALAVIYWNRSAFHRFMRSFLREQPELLAGIDFTGAKREAADEIVDRLMANEPRYHDLTWRLMDDVAGRESFPNLAKQENAAYLTEQARAAVAELRRYTIDHAAQQRANDEFARQLADFREENVSIRKSCERRADGRRGGRWRARR